MLVFALLLGSGAYAVSSAPEPSAAACILIEASSGRVLYEKKADEPMLVASTTKLMTALVVAESCAMDESVTIRPEWTGIEGSSMYLAAGECYTVYELLGGMLLASGNDAAVALACHAAGSIADFAVRMNELAGGLGCEHTHFSNPSGLDDERNYSCARDLARIACRAIENASLRELMNRRSMTIGGTTYYNHNKLLGSCEGVFAGKTGYTMAAGRTLVSCCERGGMTLVCVTLNDRNDWFDHRALYDWGYENWHMEPVAPSAPAVPLVGGEENSLPVAAGETVALPVGEGDEVSFSYELPRFVFAGVSGGERLGTANVYLNGAYVRSISLVSASDAPQRQEERPLLRFLKNIGRNTYTF